MDTGADISSLTNLADDEFIKERLRRKEVNINGRVFNDPMPPTRKRMKELITTLDCVKFYERAIKDKPETAKENAPALAFWRGEVARLREEEMRYAEQLEYMRYTITSPSIGYRYGKAPESPDSYIDSHLPKSKFGFRFRVCAKSEAIQILIKNGYVLESGRWSSKADAASKSFDELAEDATEQAIKIVEEQHPFLP